MIYLESSSHDPYFNLAMEQFIFDELPDDRDYFFLWQNDNAIIVGKHQNTAAEVNADFVREHDIRVARRLSGGGAVYHDLGNVNYTFITDAAELDRLNMRFFCEPLVRSLASLGVTAEISGRNDVTIDGRKCCGNSQYVKRGRVMHHGCILYDADLSVLSQALNVRPEKFRSKATKSVRSRVTNIRPFVKEDLSTAAFFDVLRRNMAGEELEPYGLTEEDLAAVRNLREKKYATWEWNYGASPKYDVTNSAYIEGCGFLELSLNVAEGSITGFAAAGDYFSILDPSELHPYLLGTPLRADALAAALKEAPVGACFQGLSTDQFISLLLA